MKVCTVILTYDSPLYNHFDNIKRKYLTKHNEEFYFLYNGLDNTKHNIDNRQLNYYSNEGLIPVMYKKFIDLIDKNFFVDYDYVIRCNSSTFVNIELIKKFINSNNSKELYMGSYEPDWDFISGTCCVFSQDVLQKLNILKHHTNLQNFIEDDVVIGKTLTSVGVKKTHLDMYKFDSCKEQPAIEIIKESLKYPLIRVRNDFNREHIDTFIWDKISEIMC
jgi:hypothetical protein